MPLAVTSRAVTCLWDALQKPAPVDAPRAPRPGTIHRAVATGWISYVEVESLLYATDPRILDYSAFGIREVLAVYEIPLQWTYRRPRRDDGGFGIEMVSTTDLAHLLILLEATGFSIDPTPLCEALRPQLRTRAHLTGAEIAIWWHPKEQHRSAAKILATGPRETWGRYAETLTTATGYRADLFRDAEGNATALTVDAPKYRPTRRRLAA